MRPAFLVFAQIFALVFSPIWISVSVLSLLALPHTERGMSDPWAYVPFALYNTPQVLIVCFSIVLWAAYFQKNETWQKISAGVLLLSPVPLAFLLAQ